MGLRKLFLTFVLCLLVVVPSWAADQAINARTELDAAPASDDELPIYDTDATAGKRISVTNLLSGRVDTSGTPVADDIAQFTDSDTIKGMTYAELAAIAGFESALEAVLDIADLQGYGTAASRAAEDTMTDGANLPDGAAIKVYGDTNWDQSGFDYWPSMADDDGECLSTAPGSPTAGTPYCVAGESTWDTALLDRDVNYLVIYDGASYKGVVDEDGTLLIDAFTGATPQIVFKDTDATAGDDNVYFTADCTDAGDGTEDCNLTLYVQIAGTATAVMTVNADGHISLGTASMNLQENGTRVSTRTASTTETLTNKTYDGGGTGNVHRHEDGTDPTVSTAGDIKVDTDDHMLRVYTDAQKGIPARQYYPYTVFEPDQVNDEIGIFQCDAAIYPHGCTVIKVTLQLPADAAYTLPFEEWDGDPPANQNATESLTTTSSDNYASSTSIDDATLDADDWLYLDLPATDVDWISGGVVIEAIQGD